MAEQVTLNHWVAGSIPARCTARPWVRYTIPQIPESGRSQTRRAAYVILILLLLPGCFLLFSSAWCAGVLLIFVGLIVPSGVLLLSRRVCSARNRNSSARLCTASSIAIFESVVSPIASWTRPNACPSAAWQVASGVITLFFE